MTPEEMYTEYLRLEGYRPDLEKDGAVLFKKDDRHYLIILDDDAEFFDLRTIVWTFEGPDARARARREAQTVMGDIKAVKVIMDEDSVWLATQLYCTPPESFKGVFVRCLALLEHGRKTFAERMKA